MAGKIRRDLLLEGLECTYCAARIGEEVGRIKGVKDARMDFKNSTLAIEADDVEDIDEVIDRINEIIQKHQHQVAIKEKILDRNLRKVFLIAGLSCVDCAGSMERAIGGIEGVNYARIDFNTGKLVLEVDDDKKLQRILKEAGKKAARIETGVRIVDEISKEERTGSLKKLRMAVAAVFFLVLFFIPIDTGFRFYAYLLCYLIAGYDILWSALNNIIKGKMFNENLLMGIATAGAIAIGEYPEAVAVMLFYQIGSYLQDMAVNRSRRSIGELIRIRPEYANLVSGEKLERVDPNAVKIGDVIVVKPGERIPLDGEVIEGTSNLDTSVLTGESLPREAGPGSDVLAGSINLNGVLKIKVKNEFSVSAVSRILELVENASARKAPTENFITRFASVYTPIVVAAAVLLAFVPPLFIYGGSFEVWINRALVFLVVSCPCALVISIPLGFFSGIGSSSKNGILIKGSNYLEALNSVGTVIFDKTGTLTEGVFRVKQLNAVSVDEQKLLEYAAYAEAYSNHPIALSILKAYNKKVDKSVISKYDEVYGLGIKANINDEEVVAGNLKMMQKEGIITGGEEGTDTVVYIAVNKEYAGSIFIGDEIRDDSIDAVNRLKKAGIKNIIMLTGDNKRAGEQTAARIGIDEVYTGLLPHQKVEMLEEIEKKRQKQKKLLFVGDGINDAPIIARADIGVAMGGDAVGSDAALEAADIVILNAMPSKLADALDIAGRTRNIVWQNIGLALLIKAVVLILGAAGIASMWEAVFADVGVTLIAVMNSLRLLKQR